MIDTRPLEALVKLMVGSRVLKLDYTGDEIAASIELHPSAFDAKPAATEETPDDPDKPCKCGHATMSAHNTSGCLMGCSIEACGMGEPEGTEP